MLVTTQNTHENHLRQVTPLLYDMQTSFLQVKALAEVSKGDMASLKEIQTLSKHALTTLDYALFAVNSLQTELPLTSVSAAAAAQDVVQDLRSLSKSYGVELELDFSQKLEPVYANEAALKGVLFGLVSSLILSQKFQGSSSKFIIAAQQTSPKNQRIGVYSAGGSVKVSIINQARSLASKARSLAPGDIQGSGLGLVVSDQLAEALGSELQQFTHRKQKGIGFYVPMSAQLSFL